MRRLCKAGPEGMARIIRETEPSKPSTRLSLVQPASNNQNETPSSIAAQKRSSDPKSLARELRGDLDWITLKAMEKDRTRRYESASGLAADIRRYLDDELVTARPPSTQYRVGKFVRRHRMGVGAAAVVLLALLLGVVGTTMGMIAAPGRRGGSCQTPHGCGKGPDFGNGERGECRPQHGADVPGQGGFRFGRQDDAARLEIYRKIRGPEHADVANAIGELAYLQQSAGDLKAAEASFTDSLQMYQRLEPAHAAPEGSVASALERLGALYSSANRTEDAERTLRKSLELYRGIANPDAQGLASTLGDLGMLLYRKGETGQAEGLLVESLNNWRKVPGFESWVAYDIAAIAQGLSRIHLSRNDKAGDFRLSGNTL